MRILIADDNQPVRRGIAANLSSETNWEICGEAADADETLRKVCELHPDLVLLDVSMPGLSGLAVARLLRQQVPSTKILIMSQNDPDLLLSASLEAGALGCVDKARIATDLVRAIRKCIGTSAS